MTVTDFPDAEDDGLYYEDSVGAWVEDKHRLVALYQSLFATGMKHKWENRVYVDLFSGPGMVRVRETRKFLWGSPFLALQAKDPFDQYIFCERDSNALDALRTRVSRFFPKVKVSYVEGDCNENAKKYAAGFRRPPEIAKSCLSVLLIPTTCP